MCRTATLARLVCRSAESASHCVPGDARPSLRECLSTGTFRDAPLPAVACCTAGVTATAARDVDRGMLAGRAAG